MRCGALAGRAHDSFGSADVLYCRTALWRGAAWRTAVQAGREILRIGDVPNGGILFVSQGEPFKGDGTLSPRGSTPRKPAVAAELNGNGKHKGKALAGAVRCGADLRLAVRAAPCSAVGPPTACRSCGVRWSRSSSTAPSGGPETRQLPETQTHRPFPLSVYHTCAHAFCPPRPPQPSPASARRHGLACEQAKRVALALLVGRRRRGSPVLHLGCMLCWLHAACYSVRACASATGARDVPRHSRAAVRACDAQARLGTERARDLQLVHRRRIRHGTDRPALSAPRGNARSARLGSARSSDVLCHCRRFP